MNANHTSVHNEKTNNLFKLNSLDDAVSFGILFLFFIFVVRCLSK